VFREVWAIHCGLQPFSLSRRMIADRKFQPAGDEILYHYCSPETFLAICEGKALRFSDLAAMNDFMEVHWGHQIWERAASAVVDRTGTELLNDIGEILFAAKIITVPVACCLSTDGDVLSQWRAYAADGAGYAVGFRAADLANMPVQPLRVSYDEARQLEELKTLILAIHDVEETEVEKRSAGFQQACFTAAWDLAAFKNPAFSEEQEVRLLHIIGHEVSNRSFKLVDGSGHAFGKPASPKPVRFRMKGSIPVPYLDLDFTGEGTVAPIAEVILGPKNDVDLLRLAVVLETLGVPNVQVRKSKASYR